MLGEGASANSDRTALEGKRAPSSAHPPTGSLGHTRNSERSYVFDIEGLRGLGGEDLYDSRGEDLRGSGGENLHDYGLSSEGSRDSNSENLYGS